MPTKNRIALLSGLLLIGLLLVLSGCGQNVGSQPGAGGGTKPDSARIEISMPGPGTKPPVVTLTSASMVQQLYATVYALPSMPAQIACTLELGPAYTLTFLQGGKTLVAVHAERYGCRVITIGKETGKRQGTQDFWTQLDQAIYQGTPPAKPQSLAIMHTSQEGQPPQSAQIMSAAVVQKLYNAILALPLVPQGKTCMPEQSPEYQLVFHTNDQQIPSIISKNCNSISLQGNYHSRGGTYTMNDQFKRLLNDTLSGATFATARPDQLLLNIQPRTGTSRQIKITDAVLMQKIYEKTFVLPKIKPFYYCPSGKDKIDGIGTFYAFSFSQWDLLLLEVSVYEGSCTYITFNQTTSSLALEGDQVYWNLVHSAVGQK